jgi:DNA-binding transcriptional ArsR family regulator
MTKLIAEEAANRHPDPSRRAEDVSEREWNAAREHVEGGEMMPLAWETKRQICSERTVSWKDLLCTLSETSTAERALRTLTREEPWPELGDAEIAYALLAAAQFVGKGDYLTQALYKKKREEVLARDRRRKDGGQLRLPSVDQILSAVGGDWQRALVIAGLPFPVEDERSHQRTARKRNHWDSHYALISEIQSYIKWLNGKRSTQRIYLAYRRDHPEAPALDALKTRGGLPALVRKAKNAGALERALEADRAAATPEAIEARRKARLAADAQKPQAVQITDLLRERGVLSSREIERACGWPVGSSVPSLHTLIETGAIVRTHAVATAKNARYKLPGDLTPEQETDAAARRAAALLASKKGERIWAFFRDGAEATTDETAEALGISPTTARIWIKRLLDAGRIKRRVDGLPGGGRSYVYHASP